MFALTRFFPMLRKIRVYVNETETNYSEQNNYVNQNRERGFFSLRQLGCDLVAVAIEERCLVFERGSMTLHWKILNCFPP